MIDKKIIIKGSEQMFLKNHTPHGTLTVRCIFMLMIHTADLHLGASPDAGEPWGKNRKEELWDSFERLIEAAEKQKADLLLIAGDIFHRPPLLRELRELNDRLSTLSRTKVVLMAGNHDHIGANSFYKGFTWADNVRFFEEEEISSVKFPDLKAEVYGLSYHRKEIKERLYDEIEPEDNGYYHILLAHGGDEQHIPYTKERLAKSGFDYIAFGHIHKPGLILPGKAVMAGSLEPTDHTCCGLHGFVRVEVKDGRNEIALIPFAKREYRRLQLWLTVEDTMGSIYRKLCAKIAENGKDHIYEVILKGRRHASLEIMEEKLKSAGNIRVMIDETEKFYDYEQLCEAHRGQLLERYIRSFEKPENDTEKKALAYGTEAILEALDL